MTHEVVFAALKGLASILGGLALLIVAGNIVSGTQYAKSILSRIGYIFLGLMFTIGGVLVILHGVGSLHKATMLFHVGSGPA